MAHTALYGGTVYEKKGGADLVGGTVYKKDHGKVLVGGTAYEVGFGVPCTVTILAYGISPNGSANVTLDGQTYSAKGVVINPNNYTTIAELTVPSGTVMSCSACTSVGNARGTIVLNGTNVAEAASAGVPVSYDYVVNGNIQVELNEAHVVVSNLSASRVLITEIPEGHALVQINAPRYTSENPCSVTINGITYTNIRPNKGTLATLIVPVGTEIHCVAYWGDYANGGYIYVNDTQVAKYNAPPYDYNNTKAEYTYVVTGNVDIQLETKDYSKEYYGGNIYITEL